MNIYQMQEQELEQQRENALSVLERYKQERYGDIEIESVPQLLYTMLNDVFFEDHIHKFQENIVSLLSFLLKPAVAALFRKEFTPMLQDEVSQNLLRLYDFFRCLGNEEYYTLLIKGVEIEHTDSLERLLSLQRQYNAKLSGLKIEQEGESAGHQNNEWRALTHV